MPDTGYRECVFQISILLEICSNLRKWPELRFSRHDDRTESFPGVARSEIERANSEKYIAKTRPRNTCGSTPMGHQLLAVPAIPAAFLYPLRNRPLLSEMDPNKLAREQPKLCYWNKLRPWRGGSDSPIHRSLIYTHTHREEG